ncbi:MAG TPA: hypothetical protein VFX23_05150 [Limnobacter sp.]|uniref:hypothetical protein n=1 Tax=Limnobacter sp. TaxID=2003368 RepID=UPI002E33C21A|nr:hypothetical protein [Limnobacter sp.]HEX5485364.1 hypothetical protein [Limnobacter sp.]
MNSFEISSSSGEPRSQADIIHERNMRQYDAEMAQFLDSCPRQAACNLGCALVCCGSFAAGVLALTRLSDLDDGKVGIGLWGGGAGAIAIGALLCKYASMPCQPTHPDHEYTSSD